MMLVRGVLRLGKQVVETGEQVSHLESNNDLFPARCKDLNKKSLVGKILPDD